MTVFGKSQLKKGSSSSLIIPCKNKMVKRRKLRTQAWGTQLRWAAHREEETGKRFLNLWLKSPLERWTYLASSTTSTSAWAVIGALEWAPVGSSTFSSPLVELTTWNRKTECDRHLDNRSLLPVPERVTKGDLVSCLGTSQAVSGIFVFLGWGPIVLSQERFPDLIMW